MQRGSLSDFFAGVGAKTLTDTEINPDVSRGHELQGVTDFRAFLGTPTDKPKLPVIYMWLSDEEPPLRILETCTWYDSRRGKLKRDPEYRLYYPKKRDVEDVVYRAKAGDTVFLCKPKEGPLLLLFCGKDSSIEQQLLWLFDLKLRQDFEISQIDFRQTNGRGLDITGRYILDLIGIEAFGFEDTLLEKLLRVRSGSFSCG